jgi:MFS family permease
MSVFRSLQVPAYRRFFFAQGVSLVGNWLSLTATGWLAYELTRDAFSLGLVVFAQQLPVLLFAPLAGVLGDRVDLRRLFAGLQVACALHAAALAALSLSGHLTFGWLVGLAVLRGLVNAAEFPTRQSLTLDLVGDRTHLPNAIALNSSLFNVARMLGPACAGLVIAHARVGWCYVLDAASCVPVVLVMLHALRRSPPAGRPASAPPRPHPLRALGEGLAHVARSPGLRGPLLLIALTAFSGFAAATLAPLVAREFLGGDARTLGWLQAAVGLGALGSAFALGASRSPAGLERWVGRGPLLIAAGQAVCALSTVRELTLAGMTVFGSGIVLTYAGSNTLLQLRVEADKRSRVMGLFSTAQSVYPLGGLAVGALAATGFGPRATILLNAAVCALGGLLFLRATRARGADDMERLREAEEGSPIAP